MSLKVSTGAEPKALSDLLKYELAQSYTREHGTYLAGDGAAVSVALGAVLGKPGARTIASAANVGNTGAGVLSGVALGLTALVGVYTLECITESNGAAVFAVFDPAGRRLADATEAVAYDNGQIAFTVGTNSPTTEFAAGDGFTITVTGAAGKYAPLDLTAVDGGQIVSAISLKTLTVPDGADATGLVLRQGPAIVLRSELTYPAGATDAQKAAIDAALAARGIDVVDAV